MHAYSFHHSLAFTFIKYFGKSLQPAIQSSNAHRPITILVTSIPLLRWLHQHKQRAGWTTCVLRMLVCGSRCWLCRQQQALDGADRTVATTADLVPPHNPEFVGTTADLAMPLARVPYPVRRRETARPATSGDEFCWPSNESPILCVRPLHCNEFSSRHGRRG